MCGDKLGFAALRPDFRRLIPHTAETPFKNQNTFFFKTASNKSNKADDNTHFEWLFSQAPFIWRKVVPGRRVLPAYPSYPGGANFSYISLQNLANRLHEKQKVGSARGVTRLAGLPFCDGRVTLLAGPTFLHINTLARLPGSTRSRRDDQSMRELCCYWKVSFGSGRGVNFFLI